MGGRLTRLGFLLCAGFLTAACTITTQINAVAPQRIAAVCIKENDVVWSKEFLPALRAEFERRGIATTVYEAEPPSECRHRVEYTASWKWDMAVYLAYADILAYDGATVIGQATYDARHGSGRFDKFGRTTDKLERLMTELLRGVNQGESPRDTAGGA
jgi:hypothetical protein